MTYSPKFASREAELESELATLRAERDALREALRDIAEHADHSRLHGIAESAFSSIRDKARAALARCKG